ncbi:DNA polymerase III subunit delta [Ilumatobacter sp.]|uniref:DNA polymerase III subunit delta n=1 Tax=Ilumatobacter sp. TaxID=1967498 RepID=UPI003B5232B9
MATFLVTGDDESLVRTAVAELVDSLVGDGDRSIVVDEFDTDDYELRAVVDAAQTPPFLTDRRVVVARGVSRFNAADLPGLLAYLDDPLDSSDLVLAEGGDGRMSKKLSDAVTSTGTVVATAPPRKAADRQGWIRDHIERSGLTIDRAALVRLTEWLGEDPARLDGLLATLAGAFGQGATLGEPDVEPFLGEAGGVPPWDLTDAISRGDTAAALTLMGRMVHGGGRHPLQVMATLHHHYVALARLDGSGARSEKDAAVATGLKGFPAKKALQGYERLGGTATRRALELLAQADLDLRGARDLEPELVMEVLVARLSKLRR